MRNVNEIQKGMMFENHQKCIICDKIDFGKFGERVNWTISVIFTKIVNLEIIMCILCEFREFCDFL